MNGFSKQILSCSFLWIGSLAGTIGAAEPKVAFDIPSKVECRDVTPPKCRAAHPTLKLIEARFRISATYVEGNEASTSDFVYIISSPEMRLKILSFLPDTTMESVTAQDRIEVTDNTESSDSNTGDIKVGYSLLSLGATKSSSNKRTESNHYQKVAPKNLVLASGTVNRGNGVFYKLRPSNETSLEGAKEFVLMCVVPRQWRGDWCSVVCSARAIKKSSISSSVSIASVEHAHVGLYLAGDDIASDLADELTFLQLSHGRLLSKHLSKEALHNLEELHSNPTSIKPVSNDWVFRVTKFKSNGKQTSLEEAKESLVQLETRFAQLTGKSSNQHSVRFANNQTE